MALSSTEAEFVALAETCQQAIHLKGLFDNLNRSISQMVMHEDNQMNEDNRMIMFENAGQ